MTIDSVDSSAILQLVARADAYATARDADSYAALFTEDAVMEGAMGTAHGTSALRDAVASVWAREPAGTLHLTLNAVIDLSGEQPGVDSIMLMVIPGPPPAILSVAKVRQALTRSATGWRISSRTIAT